MNLGDVRREPEGLSKLRGRGLTFTKMVWAAWLTAAFMDPRLGVPSTLPVYCSMAWNEMVGALRCETRERKRDYRTVSSEFLRGLSTIVVCALSGTVGLRREK